MVNVGVADESVICVDVCVTTCVPDGDNDEGDNVVPVESGAVGEAGVGVATIVVVGVVGGVVVPVATYENQIDKQQLISHKRKRKQKRARNTTSNAPREGVFGSKQLPLKSYFRKGHTKDLDQNHNT